MCSTRDVRRSYVAVFALVAAACRPAAAPLLPVETPAATPADAGAPKKPETPTVVSLAAEYWEARMRAHPLEATGIGDRRFDDRLPDLTPEERERLRAARVALRARVEALPADGLSARDRVTRALLLGELDGDLARAACQLDDWSVDARDGLQ